MLKEIKEDLTEYSKFSNPIGVILWNRGFQAMFIYRLSNLLARKRILTPVAALLTRFIQILYGIDIHWKANIGGGCRILHGMGLVISQGSVIGNKCSLYHGVTIGIKGEWTSEQAPIIGNEVKIYAGAKIIGSLTIGDEAIIGANAVVTKDCEAYAVYGGVPAKLIKKNN